MRHVVLIRSIVALGLLCLGMLPLAAQERAKIPRIGVLGPADHRSVLFLGLRAGLEELGYADERSARMEYRWAHGRFERLPALAAELVGLKVDVIAALATQAALAAQGATQSIPVVIVGVADPIGSGLVSTLARPVSNITGTSAMSVEIVGKQIELLKSLDLSSARIAVLWNPANPVFQTAQLQQAQTAARAIGLQLRPVEASHPEQFSIAFEAIRREDASALLVLTDPIFIINRAVLAELAVRGRLPMVSGSRDYAETGALMSYGPSYFQAAKRAASYVDKILKGAKPSDLPIEQPTGFELIINLRTAKALGVSVPASLLARADEVIE